MTAVYAAKVSHAEWPLCCGVGRSMLNRLWDLYWRAVCLAELLFRLVLRSHGSCNPVVSSFVIETWLLLNNPTMDSLCWTSTSCSSHSGWFRKNNQILGRKEPKKKKSYKNQKKTIFLKTNESNWVVFVLTLLMLSVLLLTCSLNQNSFCFAVE